MNKNKITIGIQTAELPSSICVLNHEGRFIEEVIIETDEPSVENLGKYLKKILQKNKYKIEDIFLIGVCIGPGSYTGIRGGLAFAKGFCQFTNIPLVGVTGFEVIEAKIKNIPNYIIMFDARGGRVYFKKSGSWRFGVSGIESILKSMKKDTLLVGSGVVCNRDIILKKFHKRAVLFDEDIDRLSAKNTAQTAVKKYNKNKEKYDKRYLLKIQPLYILPPNISRPKNNLSI